MKKIFTLSLIFITVLSANSFAQTKVGIRAGAIQSTWKGDAVGSFNDMVDFTNGYLTTKGRTGFFAGGFVSIPVSEQFSIEPGVYYSQKGFTLNGDLAIDKMEFLGVNARAQMQSHYIDMPLMLKATVGKGFQIYAGPQVSYLVKNNLNVKAGALGFSLVNQNIDVTESFNRVDVAIAGGIGYEFANGVSLNLGYDHGLSRIDQNSNVNSYNRAVKLGIGYKF